MNILGWSGQNHNTVIIHEYRPDFNDYFVQIAFLNTYGGHLYIYDNIEFAFLVCIHKHICPSRAQKSTQCRKHWVLVDILLAQIDISASGFDISAAQIRYDPNPLSPRRAYRVLRTYRTLGVYRKSGQGFISMRLKPQWPSSCRCGADGARHWRTRCPARCPRSPGPDSCRQHRHPGP